MAYTDEEMQWGKRRELTPRQLAMVGLAADGKSNKQIAIEMGVREDTVHSTLAMAYIVLRVHTRTQAVVAAWRRGLIH